MHGLALLLPPEPSFFRPLSAHSHPFHTSPTDVVPDGFTLSHVKLQPALFQPSHTWLHVRYSSPTPRLPTVHIIFMPTDAFTHTVPKAHLSTHMKLPNHCLHHTPYVHTHKYLLQKHVGSTYLCTYTNLYTFLMATNSATIKYNPLFPLQSSPPLPHDHICHTPAHLPTCTLTPRYPEPPYTHSSSLSSVLTPTYPRSPQIVLSYTPTLTRSHLHTDAYTQPSTHQSLHTELLPSFIHI